MDKPFKILGVYMGHDELECNNLIWAEITKKFKGVPNWWKLRNLTIKGKVIVTNSLCMSLLTHALSVFHLPGTVLHELNAAVNHTVVNHTPATVAAPVSLGQLLRMPLRYNPDLQEQDKGRCNLMLSGVLEKVGIARIGELCDGSGQVNFEFGLEQFSKVDRNSIGSRM